MAEKSSGNFFSNLFASLFGGNDADAEKRRQLRALSKKYSKCKYNKYYRYQGNEGLPGLGKIFYDIYKAIFPAQSMFHNMQNKNVLKNLVINYSTTEEIRALEEQFTEEKITEMSKVLSLDELKRQVNEKLEQYSEFFTATKIMEIDNLYKQLQAFQQFCTFDFFFTLKKFDKTLKEADFSSAPKFEKINAEYILDDLKDFVAVAYAIPFDADWTNLFKLLKTYKGAEPISLGMWKRIVAKILSIKQSEAFDLMIKLISENPSASVSIQQITSNIVEPQIEKIKNDAEGALRKMENLMKTSAANDLVHQLFGDAQLSPLRFYTDAMNQTFSRKGLKNFLHYQALGYVKAFLMEIVKKDIHEYYDLIIVRGQWDSQGLCAPFSDSYNRLITCFDKICAFDADLAEDAPTGVKIKTLLPKTERDNSAKNIINRFITESNETAYTMTIDCVKDIVTLGKLIKTVIDDLSSKKPSLVANWHEIQRYSDVPLRDFNIAIYKKIYLFTSLMKTSLVQPE